jgi:competence protein CoiA
VLVALNENGDWFSLANKTDRNQLLEERKKTTFYCPVCQEKLLLKLGEKNCFHFAHFKDSRCHLQSEPETLTHIQGKKDFYEWLRSQGHMPILEMYLGSIHQRADIGLTRFPQNLAFEFQCSPIPLSLLEERDKGYRSQNILPLWVWNRSRLKKLGAHLYQISPLEWSTSRFPFNHPPHNPFQRQKGFLTFYDPEEKTLTYLYHLLPLNTRKLWAEALTLQLSELTLHTFLYPHLVLNPNPIWHSAWLNQKKKWRTAVIYRTNRFEWHLQRLSEIKGVIWKAFPSVVGNPLGEGLFIETPSYLWQGWFCLQFILHKKRGDLLPLAEIKKAFKTLVENRWVILRGTDGLEEAWSIVVAYMNVLVTFDLLIQANSKTYVIKENLKWGNPFFDELIVEDAQVLFLWDRHVK